MLAFTMDIDWAPEEVISYALDLFEKHQIKCTLFCTHDSKVIRDCNREYFEVAIHPNFNSLLEGKGGDSSAIVDALLQMYPEAKGIRSHSLAQSSGLAAMFFRKGLLYNSNCLLPYMTHIGPFKSWTGGWTLPYNWEDDVHWDYGRKFDDLGIGIDADYLVMDFHPVHVYLNTSCQQDYDRARPYYQLPNELLKRRNKDNPGTCDLLKWALEEAKRQSIPSHKLIELRNLYAGSNQVVSPK